MREKTLPLLLSFLFFFLLLPGCVSDYRFSPYEPTNASSARLNDNTQTNVSSIPVRFDQNPGDNSYICACRILVPMSCIHFLCGLSGTWPTEDNLFCDFGPREAAICFPRRFGTVDEAQRDCSGRVRSTVLLALRATFAACRGSVPQQFCGIRIGCTAVTETGRVKTRRSDRCESGVCWPEPYISDASNARTATYVSREYQQIFACSEEEPVLRPSEQDVCAELL